MIEEKNKKIYSYDAAKLAMESYCAYQERSQQEVRDRLFKLGIKGLEIDTIISYLIENNFLNEARFASAYVSGKFRIKRWGKIKIKEGLKLKGVPPAIIKKALNQINEEEYLETLTDILKKKMQTLGFKKDLKTKNKLINHALSKGYESNIIFFILNNNELTN